MEKHAALALRLALGTMLVAHAGGSFALANALRARKLQQREVCP